MSRCEEPEPTLEKELLAMSDEELDEAIQAFADDAFAEFA